MGSVGTDSITKLLDERAPDRLLAADFVSVGACLPVCV
jgi:hypothetical protein